MPPKIVSALGIKPGTRLAWSVGESGLLVVRILPQRSVLARRAAGMGKAWMDKRSNPIDELIAERVQDSML